MEQKLEQRETKKLNVGVESIKSPNHINQDAVLVDEEHGAFGVFDGLGGYRGAEIAAALACDVIRDRLALVPIDTSIEAIKEAVRVSLIDAHRAIRDRAREEDYFMKMCTTATVLKIWQSKGGKRSLVLGNVGDSRAYYLSVDGKLSQITEGGDNLNQAVGDYRGTISPHIFTVDLVRIGDKILICSDGVYGQITEEKIKEILEGERDVEKVAQRLVSVGQEASRDDASAIVIPL